MIENWIGDVRGTIMFLFESPTVLAIAVIVALLMAWFQMWLFRRIGRKQAETQVIGWKTSARTVEQRHQTGIGTQDALRLRPPRRLLMVGLMSLAFFGGMAAFMGLVVLQEPAERTLQNWFACIAGALFALTSFILIFRAFTRVDITQQEITQRRLFRRRQVYPVSGVTQVGPASKNPALGVVLTFTDGRKLRLTSDLEGYADALARLGRTHPDIQKYAIMGKFVVNAAERRRAAAGRKA